MSAIIADIGYDDKEKELQVTFVQGSTWVYSDVPENVYKAFLNAPSKGKFFWRHIRNNYSGSSV